VSELIDKIQTRFNKVAARSQELNDPYRTPSNRDLIRDYGFNYFLELSSHRPGDPMIAPGFGELFRRPADDKAEQMRHARGLVLGGQVNIYMALWFNGCVPVLR